jgi:hypothetical protein
MMNTAEGRWKERNVRHDARVSVCVEDSYRFVSVNGRVELDEDHATTQRDIYGLARRYNPGFREGDYPVFATQKRITLRISIDKVVTNGV